MARWTAEAYLDWSCLMVGINWSRGDLAAFYVHIGPAILGIYRAGEG